jgi:hypothetical protein
VPILISCTLNDIYVFLFHLSTTHESNKCLSANDDKRTKGEENQFLCGMNRFLHA